jgi:DNA repair protein RAD16
MIGIAFYYSYSGDGRKAMFTLKTEILDPYVLRRTKSSRSDDLELPPRLVEIRPVRLHPIEEDFYNALYTQTKSSFDDYVREGTLLNNYAHIFDLLIRMRQSVAHPYLVLFSKSDKRSTPGVNAAIKVQDCGICHEPTTHRVISTCCQASFCRGCVDEYMESEINSHVAQCPNCREPFSIDLNRISDDDVIDDCTLKLSANVTQLMDIPSVREMVHVSTGSILHRIDLALFSSSTKIEALTKELVQMRRTSPGSKAIVFSQVRESSLRPRIRNQIKGILKIFA